MAPTIAVTTHGSIVAGTLLWTHLGQQRLTVVVKAAFDWRGLVCSPRVLAPAADTPEKLWGTPPLLRSRDRAPYRPMVDVIVQGHAVAPEEEPVTSFLVALQVARAGAKLLDKQLVAAHVVRGGQPKPLARVPLSWAHAALGDGPTLNPESIGRTLLTYPNAREQPAGLGAMSGAWPARRLLLRGLDPTALEEEPVTVPDPFDWSYFQIAPADQRLATLSGDESVVLYGMHADGIVEFQLTRGRALARLDLDDGALGFVPMELCADTLEIDPDRGGYALVWRGNAALPPKAARIDVQAWAEHSASGALLQHDGEAVSEASVESAAETVPRPQAGAAVAPADGLEATALLAHPALSGAPADDRDDSTSVMRPIDHLLLVGAPATPFDAKGPPAAARRAPGRRPPAIAMQRWMVDGPDSLPRDALPVVVGPKPPTDSSPKRGPSAPARPIGTTTLKSAEDVDPVPRRK